MTTTQDAAREITRGVELVSQQLEELSWQDPAVWPEAALLLASRDLLGLVLACNALRSGQVDEAARFLSMLAHSMSGGESR